MPKHRPEDDNNEPDIDPAMVAAQRQVFEQVVKAGENYVFAVARGIFVAAQLGTDLPGDIKGDISTARKGLLDILQATLMSKL